MSGPKAITVAPLVSPLVPVALVIGAAAYGTAALVALTADYISYRRNLSRYRRLADEWETLRRRLKEMGVTVPWEIEAADAVCKRAEAGNMKVSDAVPFLEAKMKAVETALKGGTRLLEEHIANVQRRFRTLADDARVLEDEKAQLARFLESAVPSGWPASERERILTAFQEQLRQAPAMPSFALELNAAGVRRLAEAEQVRTRLASLLKGIRRSIEREINETHKQLLEKKLFAKDAPALNLADFLSKQPPPQSPGRNENVVLEKLDKLLAQIAVLQDTGAWSGLTVKAGRIQEEKDGARRQMLYEDLALECDHRLRQMREIERWNREADQLLEEAAPYEGTAVDDVMKELKALKRAGRPVPLESYRSRMIETQKREVARLERARKRAAVLESLQELGYETSEGMETALVQAGKIVIHKPGDAEYAVEVVANDDLSILQTTMMRFADSDQLTDQQRLRDTEREEAWCEDHARLRRKMAERGLQTDFKLKMAAGAHPVKVVMEKERNQRRKAAARAPQISRIQTA